MISLTSLSMNVKLDVENGDRLKLSCSFEGFEDEAELKACYNFLQKQGWRQILKAIDQVTLDEQPTYIPGLEPQGITPEAQQASGIAHEKVVKPARERKKKSEAIPA